jgi:hypothetical protein
MGISTTQGKDCPSTDILKRQNALKPTMRIQQHTQPHGTDALVSVNRTHCKAGDGKRLHRQYGLCHHAHQCVLQRLCLKCSDPIVNQVARKCRLVPISEQKVGGSPTPEIRCQVGEGQHWPTGNGNHLPSQSTVVQSHQDGHQIPENQISKPKSAACKPPTRPAYALMVKSASIVTDKEPVTVADGFEQSTQD